MPLEGPAGIARALDPDVEVPDDRASQRLLDAALEIGSDDGIRGITVDEVAARAGVGRTTIYRRFGDRRGLVDALVVRETRRGLAAIAAGIEGIEDATERTAEGFAITLGVAGAHPLLTHMARTEPRVLLRVLNDPADPVFELVRGFLVEQIRTTRAEPSFDAEAAAELLFRIGLSYLLMPRGAVNLGDPESARRFARELIAPIVTAAAGD